MKESTIRNSDIINLVSMSWGKWGGIDVIAKTLSQPIKISQSEIGELAERTLKSENMILTTNKESAK